MNDLAPVGATGATDFSKMTGAELDAVHADQPAKIEGWSGMKVAEKRAALAGLADAPDAEPEAPGEPAPEGWSEVTVTRAQCNPVPLYVHGIGRFSLRVGERQKIPTEALEALRASDCTIEEH